MAVTHFGSTASHADTGTDVGPTVSVTTPASMVAGHVVLMIGDYRGTGVTIDVGETGGQTWTPLTAVTRANNTTRAFICVFNGTWTADPSVTVTTGGNLMTTTLHAFAGVDNTTPQDATQVTNSSGTPAGPPFDCTATAITTVTNDALVLAHWSSEDNNTWAMDTVGFTNVNGTQIRNSTTFSNSAAYKVFASAGDTGAIVNEQATLGGDPYVSLLIALRPAAGGSIEGLAQLMQNLEMGHGAHPAVGLGGLIQS